MKINKLYSRYTTLASCFSSKLDITITSLVKQFICPMFDFSDIEQTEQLVQLCFLFFFLGGGGWVLYPWILDECTCISHQVVDQTM